jgi:hypothetical protein
MFPQRQIMLEQMTPEQQLQQQGFNNKGKQVIEKDVQQQYLSDRLVVGYTDDKFKVYKRSEFNEIKGDVFRSSDISTRLLKASSLLKPAFQFEPKQYLNINNDFIGFQDSIFVIAISHCWETADHPDPKSYQLDIIQKSLKEKKLDMTKVGVFYDYSCLPQNTNLIKRERNEEMEFKSGLETMNLLYMMADEVWVIPNAEKIEHFKRSWCVFEYIMGNITGNIRNKSDFELPNSKLEFNSNPRICNEFVEVTFSKTKCTNGTDLIKIKELLKRILMKNGTSDIHSCVRNQYIMAHPALHYNLFTISKNSKALSVSDDVLDWDQSPLIPEDIEFVKKKLMGYDACCDNNAKLAGKIGVCLWWCGCCGVCFPLVDKCQVDDFNKYPNQLSNTIFVTAKWHTENAIHIIVARSMVHIKEYTIHAKNIESDLTYEINRIYGSFSSFIDQHLSGFIDQEICDRLETMNAITYKNTKDKFPINRLEKVIAAEVERSNRINL